MNKKRIRAVLAGALAFLMLFTGAFAWAEEEREGSSSDAAMQTADSREKSDADSKEKTVPAVDAKENDEPAANKKEKIAPAQDAAKGPAPAGPAEDAAKGPAPAGPAEDAAKGPAPAGPAEDAAKGPAPAGPAEDAAKGPAPAGPAEDAAKGPAPAGPAEDAAKGPAPADPAEDAAKDPASASAEDASKGPASAENTAKGPAPASSVPSTALTPAMSGGGVTMVVRTGNAGKLHLRQQPTTASPSMGLFPNGTLVKVHGVQYGWALVTVNGLTGYMATQYLSGTQQNLLPPEPVIPVPQPSLNGAIKYMIRTGNTGKLHLREYPSTAARSLGLYPNGTILHGVDQGNGWVYVSVSGRTGYMMKKFLTTHLNPGPQPDPNPGPQPPDPQPGPNLNGAVTKVVRTGNTGKLHLRESPSAMSASLGLYPNGTMVEAKDLGNGWSYVRVNGRLGYMMSRYLAAPGPNPDPAPDPHVLPTAAKAKTYQKNHSYVNLRSSKASSNNSNVIAHVPHGTTVDVLQWGETYTKVNYNGMTGYIITSYLRPIP